MFSRAQQTNRAEPQQYQHFSSQVPENFKTVVLFHIDHQILLKVPRQTIATFIVREFIVLAVRISFLIGEVQRSNCLAILIDSPKISHQLRLFYFVDI